MPLHAGWFKNSGGPDSVRALATGNTIFGGDAGANVILAGKNGGAFLSTNSGTSWSTGNYGMSNPLTTVTVTLSALFAGTSGGGIFRSTNVETGTDVLNLFWKPINTGLSNMNVTALLPSGNVAGTDGGGVFLSTNINDTSVTWSAVNTGLTNRAIRSLAISGANIFAGTNGGGVFISTNSGANWTAVNTGLANMNVYALAVSGANVFAGTNGGGVFISTNSGANWTAAGTGLTSSYVHSLVFSMNLFAGTDSGVFMSTNNGANWTAVNTGLTNLHIRALAVLYSDIYAGADNGVWRRPLSEMVTSIADRSIAAPPFFRLLPTGALSFILPFPARVTLIAYKLTGEKAVVLLDERLSAGSYERRIHTSALPHGLYLYRIQAGEITETRKVLLAR
jgi:hypothetical protein